MLDTAIGPVRAVVKGDALQVHVTHVGTHNKFRYNTYETVVVANNRARLTLLSLVGHRIRCHVHYRDQYNRLYADIYLEPGI